MIFSSTSSRLSKNSPRNPAGGLTAAAFGGTVVCAAKSGDARADSARARRRGERFMTGRADGPQGNTGGALHAARSRKRYVVVVLAVPLVLDVPLVPAVPYVPAVSVPVIVFVCAEVSVSAEIVVVAVVSVCTTALSVATVDVIVVSVASVSSFLQANIASARSMIAANIRSFFIQSLL